MWSLVVFSTFTKSLLFRAYRSTDFEVHRNWLAITSSLPISKWYIDNTSEWTLDYPPFFAWFERILSIFATFADSEMLKIDNLNYASERTVIFQRTTVIVTELVLLWALWRYVKYNSDPISIGTKYLIASSLFLHPGFYIIDHIHFQYNGFLYGVLILSIVEAQRGNLLTSGIIFAILLNLKHIYLYIAPVYFVYLLRTYCFSSSDYNFIPPSFLPSNFFKLGASVIAVFAISFGPFAVMNQIPQVLGRLFPFTRGLCHAYWAPNFWALYAFADRVLIVVMKRLGLPMNEAALGSLTRGFVGDTSFAVLPTITAGHTLLLTVTVQLITLQNLWRYPTKANFLSSLTLCGFASFLFGWHVHEKAILLILVPLSLMAIASRLHFRFFIILSAAGVYSLFPLLFHPPEIPIRNIVTFLWFLFFIPALWFSLGLKTSPMTALHPLERLYILMLPVLEVYSNLLHPILFPLGEMAFLPLMLTSVWCACGILWGWLGLIGLDLGIIGGGFES